MKIFVLAFLLLLSQALAGPVSHFGALKRCGSDICGEKTGESLKIQVKGPSLFWSDGTGSPFYKAEYVDWFVENMQISVIRAAMAIRWRDEKSNTINEPGATKGYYFDKVTQMNLMKAVIDAAIENDIYVIVDWHSHFANEETSDAKTFFVDSINGNPKYKNIPNIIWEVWNEPLTQGTGAVTTHANTIISALRAAGNQNLVLIGSPTWSSQPQQQAADWGSSRDKNVAFVFHFYKNPAHSSYRSNAQNAKTAGNAIFGSEWGAVNTECNNSDAGVDEWTTWMDSEKISNCMWYAGPDKDPKGTANTCGMFTDGTGINNISTSRLTNSGKYFQTYMTTKNKWTSFIPSAHPKGNDVFKSVKDGASITLSSADLGLEGEISEISEPEFGTASKTANSITYATPKSGSPSNKVKFFYKITKGGVTVRSKVAINITDRKPFLPEKAPIAVSRRAPTDINIISTLSVQDPTGQGVEFESMTVDPPSIGTVTISSAKNIATFTPAASQHDVTSAEATLNYTVKVKGGTSNNSASVVLKLQNFAPTIRIFPLTNFAPSVPNTAPVGFGMDQNRFNGKDADGDPITIKKFYLADGYPGRVELVKPDSLVYYPDPDKIGRVVILAVITDGTSDSPTGWASVTLTGNGSEINVTPPTSIPGVIDPPPVDPIVVYQFNGAKSLGLAPIGSGRVELYFARSGVAKLDVYSLSGKKVGSLLNEHQNAGSKQVSLNSLNLQKGVYILRLSQGSQVKTLRIVN